jgi:hypothetical protein
MPDQFRTDYQSYVASLKPRNKAVSLIGVALLWLGTFHVINRYGWLYLAPYLLIFVVFTAFVGIPAIINVLRCVDAYRGMGWHLVMSLLAQALWAAGMVAILSGLGLQGMVSFFVLVAVIRPFSMPREQLWLERMKYNKAQEDKRSRVRAVLGRSEEQDLFQ